MKQDTCCFTGHRPMKLPWKYEECGIRFEFFKYKLKKTIKKAISNGYNHFISGMSIGIDMICADMVLSLKQKYKNITLECAIPCIDQTAKWNDENIMHYNNILNEADKVTIVSDTLYFGGCMAKRNKYMVENSSLLIAVFNGKNGGTKQTIRMAENQNLQIIVIKP